MAEDTNISSLIDKMESAFGLPRGLLGAVVSAESSGNPKARGKAGERGLMQIMPKTAEAYGVKNLNALDDPKTNLYVGAKHLSMLLSKYEGDVPKALESYNAGRPTPKAEGYVSRVFGKWGEPLPSMLGEAPSRKGTTPSEEETKVPLLMRKTTAMEGEDIAPAPAEVPRKKPTLPDLTVPIMEGPRGTRAPALAGPAGIPPATGPTLEIPRIAPPGVAAGAGPSLEIPSVAGLAGAVPPPSAPAAPPVPVTTRPGVPAPPVQVGQPGMPAPPEAPGLVSKALSAVGPAPAAAAEIPSPAGAAVEAPLPPFARARIRDATGKVAGYRLQDNTIAFKVIRDARGQVAGYRRRDGSIKWLGGPESPGAPELHSDIARRIGEGAQEINRMMGFALGGTAAELAFPEVPGAKNIGAGLGATAADVVNAFANHITYGTPLNITPRTLLEDAGMAALADRIGMSITDLLGYAGIAGAKYMTGRSAVEAGAREAKAAAAQTAEKEAAKQGAANLKAASQADLATQTQLSKLAYDQAQAKGTIAANEAADKMREDLKGKYLPEARQATIEGSLGRTPAETQAAISAAPEITPEGVSLPGPGLVSRRQRFYDAVFSPIRKVAKAMQGKYDAHFKSYLDNSTAAVPLGTAADAELEYAKQEGIAFLPKVQNLIARAKAMAGTPAKSIDEMDPWDMVAMHDGAKAADRLQRGSQTALENRARTIRELYTPLHEEPLHIIRRDPDTGAIISDTPHPTKKITVGVERPLTMPAQIGGSTIRKVLALRSDAIEAMAVGDGPSRKAAYTILDGADKTLEESGVPGARELGAQYRTYKSAFDKPFMRSVSDKLDPIDAAKDVFNEPQRAILIIGNADPAQKAELRRLYADMVNRDGAKVIDPVRQGPALQRLFPHAPKLADPKNWIYLEDKMVKVADVINSTPAIKQRYFADVAREVDRIRLDAANDLKNQALKEADKLGPAGARLRREIESKPPEEAVAIATKAFSGMTPEEVVQQFVKSLKSPEAAGREAIAGMPTPPNTAAKGLPLTPATTPDEAAINAIRSGRIGKSPHGMDWVKRRAPIYVLMALSGVGSGYIKTMAVLGGAVLVKERLANALAESLEDETAATAFYNAMNNPATSGWKTIVKAGANGVIDDGLSRAGMAGLRHLTGQSTSLEGEEPTSAPAPAPTPAGMRVAGGP